MLLSLFCLLSLSLSLLISTISTNNDNQCCVEPVSAFLVKEFVGPCACKTTHQKWLRYKDWIEKNNGFIHPFMDFKHITNDNRGLFSTQKTMIQSQDLLMQIPIKISFSQFLISKYFENDRAVTYKHETFNQMFNNSNIDHFLPDQFPNHTEWAKIETNKYNEFRTLYHNKFHQRPHNILPVGLRAWLALGFAWLKKYTLELLPWFELLPSPYYLPILWPECDQKALRGSDSLKELEALKHAFQMVYPYLSMLGLQEREVKEAFAWLNSRLFNFDFSRVNGEKSVMVPSGFDFFNHKVGIKSDYFYDSLFGAKNKNNEPTAGNDRVMIGNIIRYKKKMEAQKSDYLASYLWVNTDVGYNEEILVNYGDTITSSSRVAVFGFMDEAEYTNDYVLIPCWPLLSDKNMNNKYDILTKLNIKYPVNLPWYHHAYKKKMFGIKFSKQFMTYLRIIFLSEQYFDSFTISSILNQFEIKYLETSIDPIIEYSVHLICKQKLGQYPTTIQEDTKELFQLKSDTTTPKNILYRKRLIRKILIREKTFFQSCQNMQINHM